MNVKIGHYRADLTHRVRTDTPYRSTRRAFLIAAGAWPALAWAGVARAQTKQAPIMIGWLASRSRESSYPEFVAFREGLAALGWKGSQIVIEERWADGYYDRLPFLAEELAARKPAVIVAVGGQAVAAAAKAAPRTPIVMAASTDPVAAGFAVSLARPGGMITGVSSMTLDVTEKLLEILLAAAPRLKRVGFLVNTSNVNYALQMKSAKRSVVRYPVEARFAEVVRPEEIEAAISKLATEGVQALVVMASSLFITERKRIATLALARRWPIIVANREIAEAGALLTYGHDSSASYRRAGYYVDRILKGAKPSDLPIEQPTRFELVVNMKTAKALGLTIPQTILVRADRVIE